MIWRKSHGIKHNKGECMLKGFLIFVTQFLVVAVGSATIFHLLHLKPTWLEIIVLSVIYAIFLSDKVEKRIKEFFNFIK